MIDDKRQLDLLRYCRGHLHQNGLITDEEYSWLVFECQPGAVNRLEGYDTLRASLGRVERRNEELELGLEVALELARRERDEAKKDLEASIGARARIFNFINKYGDPDGDQTLEEVGAAMLADRDAARADAARLRERLGLLTHAVNVMVSTEYGNYTPLTVRLLEGTSDAATDALAAPGPTIGELQAEALEKMAEECSTVFDGDLPHVTKNDLLAEAARLRGGGE